MMKDIIDRVLGFVENAQTRLAVGALVIDSLLTAGGIAITSVSHDQTWKLDIRPEYRLVLLVLYLVLFGFIWFVLALLNNRQGVDIYSEVREKLVGQWIVNYEANIGPNSEDVIIPNRNVSCLISVNEIKKLEMVFKTHNHPLFSEGDQFIRDVAVSYSEPGYALFFYYTGKRTLVPNVAMSLRAEGPVSKNYEVELEIFGHVTIERPQARTQVLSMQGRWFDLNGNMSRLLALLDNKRVAEARGQTFTQMCLSDVPIHQVNFDADMGGIEFSRSLP